MIRGPTLVIRGPTLVRDFFRILDKTLTIERDFLRQNTEMKAIDEIKIRNHVIGVEQTPAEIFLYWEQVRVAIPRPDRNR